MSKILNTEFTEKDGSGSVTLYVNPFGKGNKYYSRFDRDTVDSETLIARIQKKKAGTNELAVQQIAGFLKQEILDALSNGESVNILDLGIMYLVPNGTYNGKTKTIDCGDKAPFTLRFTPSQLAKSRVESIQIKSIKINESGPVITAVTDLFTGNDNLTATAGKVLKLEGFKIKVTGEGSGIYLVPVDDDGIESSDENDFIECPVITKNTQSTLEFYIPDSCSGLYKVLVKTYYTGFSKFTKNARTIYSEIITVN